MSLNNGERAIDRVRKFGGSPARAITIPEWDLTLRFEKLTPADVEAAETREPKSVMERNLLLLIAKAKLEDGRPAFTTGDLYALKTDADYLIVARLITFLFDTAYPSATAAEDAITADPPSPSA